MCVHVRMYVCCWHPLSGLGAWNLAPSWGSTPRASLPRFGPAGPHLLGGGSLNSGSGGPCSRHRGFLGKLHKTKVEEHPRYSGGGLGQIRSSTSPRGPADRPVQGVGLLLWSQGWRNWNLAGVLLSWGPGHIYILDQSDPTPPLVGRPRSGSGGPWRLNGVFLGKLYKAEVVEHPWLSGEGLGKIRSRTSPRGVAAHSSAWGRSGLLLWSLCWLGWNLAAMLPSLVRSQRDVLGQLHRQLGQTVARIAWKPKGPITTWNTWTALIWHVCYPYWDVAKEIFWASCYNPCPDCSGKPVRALKGFLPGEQPKQLKFVMGKDVLWHP